MTHDSLKFSSWNDALNEPNYKILRPMVVEILESKDNNADENGPILNQKFNSATHILSRSETHDSLKFLSWKDASNEPNYEILRTMVVEILESKDNNADVTKVLFWNKNSIASRFHKLHTCYIHLKFCLDQAHRLTSTALPIQPLLIGSSSSRRVRNSRWCNCSYFHLMNQFWVEKSNENDFTIL